MERKIFVSGLYEDVIETLNSFGAETIEVIPMHGMDAPISRHADCAAFAVDGLIFAQEENADLLRSYGYNAVSVEGIASPYPCDVKLNAKLFGKKIICNEKFISDSVREYAYKNGYTIINNRQGYSACSILKINDKAAITDDISTYNALVKADIDVLHISKGSVKLDGYDYGFIGGCGGMLDEDTVFFSGNIENHIDFREIIDFLNINGVKKIVSPTGELRDFGGFIVL